MSTNKYRAVIRIVSIIVVSLLLGDSANALSNSGGGSWQYQRDITISNTGGVLSDYQVLVSLTGGNFPTNAQTSGADIRFTDVSGAELSYWIESWDYSGRIAKIWVKVTSIASGSTTIRMYYGNPSATGVSSGAVTFQFFDDFNGATVDTARWSTSGVGDISQSGGFLNVAYSRPWYQGSYSLIKSNTVFYIPFRFGMKIKDSGGINDVYKSAGVGQPTNSNYDNGGNNRVNLRRQWNGNFYDTSIESNLLSTTMDANTWYTYLFSAAPSGVDFYNGVAHQSQTSNIPSTSTPLSIYVKQWTGDNGGSATISVDYIFLAKYASPEPTITLGAEQPIDTTLPIISISSPSNGQTLTTSAITVSGTASDNIALSKIEVKVGTGSWQLASGTTSWNAGITLSPGSNTIYAKATDTSGNTNESSVTVTYDTSTPTPLPPTIVPPTTAPPTTAPPTTVPPTTVPPTTVPPTTVPPTTIPPTPKPTFRVGPSVTLRPVTDVIEENQDGIVELFMNNPSLNDVTLNLDAQVSVPSGLHVSGENFGQAAGAGVVAGTFSVPSGKSRTISIAIKADKSARKGSHTLQFTGLYYPDDNKDAFQPISLTYSVIVKAQSIDVTPTPIQTATPKTPGFSVILTMFAIVVYVISKKELRK